MNVTSPDARSHTLVGVKPSEISEPENSSASAKQESFVYPVAPEKFSSEKSSKQKVKSVDPVSGSMSPDQVPRQQVAKKAKQSSLPGKVRSSRREFSSREEVEFKDEQWWTNPPCR